jgi:hypothetical protein
MEFLRRWNDIPPHHPPIEPGPKRLIFPQPIQELRPRSARPKAGSSRLSRRR